MHEDFILQENKTITVAKSFYAEVMQINMLISIRSSREAFCYTEYHAETKR